MSRDAAPPQRVLAADIGGTNARFAVAQADATGHIELQPEFTMPTSLTSIATFTEFWQHFVACAPPSMVPQDQFRAISLAVAGAVQGESAVLTNIPWNIHADETRRFRSLYLLNDFLAQAWACVEPSTVEAMPVIRPARSGARGGIAIVGAGTGLGHGALLPHASDPDSPWFVSGSESGHGCFAFHGEEERKIEHKMLEWTGKSWLSNDDVVSGGGAELLHRALTGEVVTAAKALSESSPETNARFARFYARACRNYCLAVLPVKTLIISGGIAAKNPHLLQSSEFLDEFNDAADYSPIMQSIEVRLNLDDNLGIRGSATYALSRIRQTS